MYIIYKFKYTLYHNEGFFLMLITKENLTIIIVTIKSQKVIEGCLNSIDPDIKKIVVENSSNENFINEISSKYRNIECYLTGKNLGMGSGNNFGIKKSKTRYVMILNPDVVLDKNTIDEILKISHNLNFAILSPINKDKNYPNYKINNKTKIKNSLFEVDSVDGYAMILDKTKFENNFFDEKIFMYLENDDLCLRVKKKGEKIFVYNKSLISHLGAKAVDTKYSDEIEYSRNWHWSWSKFYFRRKHFGLAIALCKSLPSLLNSFLKFCFYFLISDKLKFKSNFYRASGLFNSIISKDSWFRPRLD